MTEPKHTIQFCCSTTCDAAANLAYVNKLEQRVKDLEAENARLTAENRRLNNALYSMSERINNGLIKGDTTGTTR